MEAALGGIREPGAAAEPVPPMEPPEPHGALERPSVCYVAGWSTEPTVGDACCCREKSLCKVKSKSRSKSAHSSLGIDGLQSIGARHASCGWRWCVWICGICSLRGFGECQSMGDLRHVSECREYRMFGFHSLSALVGFGLFFGVGWWIRARNHDKMVRGFL